MAIPLHPELLPDAVETEMSGFPTGRLARSSLVTSSIRSPVVNSSRIIPPCGYSKVSFWNRLLRLPWPVPAPMIRYQKCVVSPPWLKQTFPNHQLSLTFIGPLPLRYQALMVLGDPYWYSLLK